MKHATPLLAHRLGVSVHCSPLELHLKRLADRWGVPQDQIDEWLVDLANHRGARVVERRPGAEPEWPDLPMADLPDEDLVVLICQPQRKDHPQVLRLAGQLVSRGHLAAERLVLCARRERADRVLAELARLALRIDPDHPTWNLLARAFPNCPRPRDALLHWGRLAEPVLNRGLCDGQSWRLVA